MRLAIVDADPISSYVLAYAAQRRGHQVMCVGNADRLASNLPFTPSVVVVSLSTIRTETMKPVRTVKAALPEAVIILTAEELPPNGFTIAAGHGASDITAAPYNPHELILKAEVWENASQRATTADSTVSLADLRVDLNNYLAVKNGHHLVLTKLELRLLYCLVEHHPNLAPIDRLLTFGWDFLSAPDASLIKTHISHLRKKLNEAGGAPIEIHSRQTIGYVIRDGAPVPADDSVEPLGVA